MTLIDALGKPCPIPVIETKKALTLQETDGVLVKVDNIIAVQNLEKMANGYGFDFSYNEIAKNSYEVTISKNGKSLPEANALSGDSTTSGHSGASKGTIVVISRDTMGSGVEELGKTLIKGFIYSLTELDTPPKSVIFLNSGAYLTSSDSNAVDDLKKLMEKGTEVLTCGACISYYELQDKLAVGEITNMYGITERMVAAGNIINI